MVAGGTADKLAQEVSDDLARDEEAKDEEEDESDEARDVAVDAVAEGAGGTVLPDERLGVGVLMRFPKKVGRTFLSVGTAGSLC